MSVAGIVLDGYGPGSTEEAIVLDGYGISAPGPVALTLILDGLNGRVSSLLHEGFSAFPGLLEPPPPGKQYADLTAVTFIGDSIEANLSPAPVLGAVFIVDLIDSAGYAIQINGDGTFIVFANGDASPQQFTADLWNPVGQFDWGSWIVFLNPLPVVITPTSPGQGTPTIFNQFVDPAVQADIVLRLTRLYPEGWFQS